MFISFSLIENIIILINLFIYLLIILILPYVKWKHIDCVTTHTRISAEFGYLFNKVFIPVAKELRPFRGMPRGNLDPDIG
jgi:hypothetical protein